MLTGVQSGAVTGGSPSPMLPAKWMLLTGYLIGPGANLTNANLMHKNLTGADLTGATMNGAMMTSVTYSNTICPDATNSSAQTPETCAGHGGGL